MKADILGFFNSPAILMELQTWLAAVNPTHHHRIMAHLKKSAPLHLSELGMRDMVVALCRYFSGDQGVIPLSGLQPLVDCPKLDELSSHYDTIGLQSLSKLACIKLNGGLGTTMGCDGPKSLIHIDPHHRFIDMILANVNQWRSRGNVPIPLVLLNSYHTMADTMAAVSDPHTHFLLQHQVPRLDARSGMPLIASHSDLEWNPPGHGDLFHSLYASGLLKTLVDQGITVAFVANSDNLAATIDLRLLGYLIAEDVSFMLEATPKLASDQKGGSLAMRNGRPCLLERSQVSPDDWELFDQISQYPLFNTNSIWIHLPSLLTILEKAPMTLPLIVNPKVVEGVPVVQLETAMGAAVEQLARSQVVVVPRSRFFPVKTTRDLIVLRSNCVQKNGDGSIEWSTLPSISLSSHYQEVNALSHLIPHGLQFDANATLTLNGPVVFQKPCYIRGDVTLTHALSEPVACGEVELANVTKQADDSGWHVVVPDSSS